jgi:hypothetical protein
MGSLPLYTVAWIVIHAAVHRSGRAYASRRSMCVAAASVPTLPSHVRAHSRAARRGLAAPRYTLTAFVYGHRLGPSMHWQRSLLMQSPARLHSWLRVFLWALPADRVFGGGLRRLTRLRHRLTKRRETRAREFPLDAGPVVLVWGTVSSGIPPLTATSRTSARRPHHRLCATDPVLSFRACIRRRVAPRSAGHLEP